MYFYFSSAYPSALKLNGAYLGTLGKSVKACNLDLSTPTLIEVCPLCEGETGATVILDDGFNGNITSGSVTDLRGGYLIKFNRTCRGGEFKVFAQEKFPDAGVTVFNDGGLKISIETPSDFFAEEIRENISSAVVQKNALDGHAVIAVELKGEKSMLYLFKIDGVIEKIFEGEIDSFSFENGFTTTEKFLDMAKHEVIKEWRINNGVFTEKTRKVTRSENFEPNAIPVRLLPFAFIEEFLTGGDILPYLDESIKENADKFSGYLGEALGVMPPPLFRSIDEVGLIYKVADNRYRVDYFTFEFKEKKICNVKKSAD